MSHLFKKIVVIFSFFVLAVCAYLFFFKQYSWNKYYTKKLYLPPAKITEQAVNSLSQTGLAIDFGCGCGNDTAFLLNRGWTVWAIDGETAAIQILQDRKDMDKRGLLCTHCEKFEQVNWDKLPKVNLFLAVNALPFCKEEKFEELWAHISNKIESQGKFAGHFFGPNYKGFTDKERQSMTFLSKEAVLELFKGFDIEFFDEKEATSKSGTGRPIHSHIFEIIAVKL